MKIMVFDVILSSYDEYFQYPGVLEIFIIVLCLFKYVNGKPEFKFSMHVDICNSQN